MRTIKRIGGSVVVAAGIAAAAASPAAAMISPTCSTRVVAADTGSSGSCSFGSQNAYATLNVTPVSGSVTASLHCMTWSGWTYDTSRTVSSTTTWRTYAPGTCTLTLTSLESLTTAEGTAGPGSPPIFESGPDPA